jgi:hypothetical protein
MPRGVVDEDVDVDVDVDVGRVGYRRRGRKSRMSE